MVAFALPIKSNSRDLQATICADGLTRQVPNSSIQELIELLKGICEGISYRLQ
jgi:DNA-binding IclR family transcriptional regulator